jgi:hypothetical protein
MSGFLIKDKNRFLNSTLNVPQNDHLMALSDAFAFASKFGAVNLCQKCVPFLNV